MRVSCPWPIASGLPPASERQVVVEVIADARTTLIVIIIGTVIEVGLDRGSIGLERILIVDAVAELGGQIRHGVVATTLELHELADGDLLRPDAQTRRSAAWFELDVDDADGPGPDRRWTGDGAPWMNIGISKPDDIFMMSWFASLST
ncbi:MAG: hypothetical protein R3C97_11375 [Geminicoccaceae bacterium]